MARVAPVTPCNKSPQLPWGLALASRCQPPAPRPPPALPLTRGSWWPPPRQADQQSARNPAPTSASPRARLPRLQHRWQQGPAGPGRPSRRLTQGKTAPRTPSSPQKTSRGQRGAWAGARQGYTPRSRDPKLEIALVHLHYRQGAMARGGGAGKGRLVSQRGPSLSPGCFTSDIKNLERLPGGGVMEGVALHLGRGGIKLAKSKPLAPTGLQSVRAVSHLGVDT